MFRPTIKSSLNSCHRHFLFNARSKFASPGLTNKRHAGSYVSKTPFKPPSLNDMPVPKGSWARSYEKKQRYYNAFLLGSAAFTGLTFYLGTSTGKLNFYSGPELKGELVSPVLKNSEIIIPEKSVEEPALTPLKDEEPAPPKVEPTPPKVEKKVKAPAPPKVEEKVDPPKVEKTTTAVIPLKEEKPKVETKKEYYPQYPSTTLADGKNNNDLIDISVSNIVNIASGVGLFNEQKSGNFVMGNNTIANKSSSVLVVSQNNIKVGGSQNSDDKVIASDILSKASEVMETNIDKMNDIVDRVSSAIEDTVLLDNISLGETDPIEFASNIASENSDLDEFNYYNETGQSNKSEDEIKQSDQNSENESVSDNKQTKVNFIMDITEEASPFPYTVHINIDQSDCS